MVRLRSLCRRSAVAAAVSVVAFAAASPPVIGQESRTVDDGRVDSVDLEVLMRGPVHEGFAEPAAESRGFLELPEPAPEPIEELPARAHPTDEHRDATWVPGYWGIEGENEELVWVSGTWRYAPPNTRWVPGYWATVDDGSVWVSGFWVDDSLERVEYLPPPPPVDDFEPTVEAPGDDYFWVPGNYVWTGSRYVWEEGFWTEAQPNWVWTPARYVWTPRGYIYVSGYWDYPVERRGALFAPVRVATTYREVYRPRVVINVGRALVHWFVRPDYRHYYFGNYYGDRYQRLGFTPWVAYVDQPTYYDPLYSYYRATRSDYLQTLVQTHRRIDVANASQMPVSYREYQQIAAASPQQATTQQTAVVQLMNFAQPVEQVLSAERAEGEMQFDELSDQAGTEMEQYREQIQSVRQFARGRSEAEVDANGRAGEGLRARGQARAQARRSGEDRQDAREEDQASDQARDRGDAAEDEAEEGTERSRTSEPSQLLDRAERARRGDTDRPDTDRPDTDRPDTDRPDTDRPDTDRPDADRPDADRPDADRPDADRPDADRPDADRPDADRPDADRSREAAERARGSFDLGPFRGRARGADRADDARGRARSEARGEARREARGDLRDATDPAEERAERGGSDTADAVRDSLRQRTPRRGDTERLRSDQSERGAGRADANRPPPLLSRPGARGGQGEQPEAAGRRRGGDAAPGRSRSAAERAGGESDRPARRPSAEAPGGEASPDGGRPRAETPRAETPAAGAGAGAGGNAGSGGSAADEGEAGAENDD